MHHFKNYTLAAIGVLALAGSIMVVTTKRAGACLIVMAAILLSSCQQQVGSNTNASTPSGSPVNTSRTATEVSKVKAGEGVPVEFTAIGITPDKANVAYRIKVNTDKPIDEVHLTLKATDSKGKVTEDTIVWQNIVGSTRRPIESGKVYDDQSALDPATVKADVSLKEVLFKDGTKWSAR